MVGPSAFVSVGVGKPFVNPYRASKYALEGMMQSLAIVAAGRGAVRSPFTRPLGPTTRSPVAHLRSDNDAAVIRRPRR